MRLIIGSTLICLLELVSCGRNAAKAPGKLPIGFLDSPKPAEIVRGNYQIAGWALSESGIDDVSVFIDRDFAGKATLGHSRPDLAGPFAAFPNAPTGGFEYHWDTSQAAPGPHELTVQARTHDGSTRDLGTVGVTIAR